MPTLGPGPGYIDLDGKRIPLISGEFHFWRIQASNWRAILEQIKKLGVKVVATYVCWDFHQIEPGRYDLTGETTPQHDFKGFLELTREMGFYLMVRPGPYIYSEWKNGGVTDEAAKVYRLSERFAELSRPWIEAVAGVIAPFQATRGGHVIMLQPDNEPYPAIPSRGAEIGCYGEQGLFKQWMARRYDESIDKLNAAWRTEYASFDEVCIWYEEPYVDRSVPINGRLCPAERFEQRVIDSQDFVEWYAVEIVGRVGSVYRQAGIDVPFFTNGWHPYAQNFYLAGEVAEFRGVDLYPPANFEPMRLGTHSDPWEYSMEILKVAAGNVGWGYSAELEAGFWEGLASGEYDANAVEMMNLAFMANGLKGWNWYMLVGRDNWVHSPINPFGVTTPYYPAYQRVVKLAETIGLHELDVDHDIDLVTQRKQRCTDFGNWRYAWNALTDAGVDFGLVDTAYTDPRAPMVMYAGSELIEDDEVDRLVKAAEDGATLVVFNIAPRRTRDGRQTNPFGIPDPDGLRPLMSPFAIECGDCRSTMPRGGHIGKVWCQYFASVPEGATPIVATPSSKASEILVDLKTTQVERNRFNFGYVRPMGKGKLVVLGISPCEAALSIVTALTDCTLKVRPLSPKVSTTVLSGPSGRYLFVINRNRHPLRAQLELDVQTLGNTLTDVECGETVQADDKGRVDVTVPGYNVKVYRIG